jgi:hypothetical protein
MLPPTIAPITGPFHQRVQEIAAGAAVAAGAARALDLRDGGRALRDGRLDGAIGHAAAETDDHARGLRGAAACGAIIRERSVLLGASYCDG